MWLFIKPTKLKIISTFIILVISWLTEWFSNTVSIAYFESLNPEYLKTMSKALEPEMSEMISTNTEALVNAGLNVFIIQIIIIIIASYITACLLIYLFSRNIMPAMQSNKKLNMDSGADAPPPVN